jgi:2-polyprenyl-3-methyl-5-hydroxy-6-metoxy-1,4-benzoquinol methylase
MNQIIEVYHLHETHVLTKQRYYMALSYCEGKNVLDMACNTGYGSSILAMVAASVTGYDHEPRCIQFAKKNWERPNVRYVVADALALPPRQFDVVVALEMLEHIEAPFEVTITKLREQLVGGGVLIISVPIGEQAEPNGTHCHTHIQAQAVAGVIKVNGFDLELVIHQGDLSLHAASYSQAMFFARKKNQ